MNVRACGQQENGNRVCARTDSRDLVEVLKAELAFLEEGGYQHSPYVQWRPRFFFEDSCSCPNYLRRSEPVPCSECVLRQLLPEDCREKNHACRLIPLNNEGYTLDMYYRFGTEKEAEAALAAWLRKTIADFEHRGTMDSSLRSGPAPPDAALG